MAAMKGGFGLDILNYNSIPENNNSGTAGPTTPSLHEKNNFMRYTLPSEIINLDDDVSEIQNLNNGFPPFSMPAQTSTAQSRPDMVFQTRPDMGSLNFKMPPQTPNSQIYSYQNGMGLPNYKNGPHTGPLGELLEITTTGSDTGFSNYKITPQTGPPQTFSYRVEQEQIRANRFETHCLNYVNPPHTGQMECRTNLGFPNSNSDYLMPAQQIYPSSSSLPIRPDMGYSNLANNGINGSSMNFANMVNNNPHEIVSSQTNGSSLNFSNPEIQPQTGMTCMTQTEPGLFPLGMPPQIEFSEQQQQQQQQVVPTEEVGTNQITLENQGIDLNKTPQQKQRRRKYVPKVVIEGKKTRSPKIVTPKPGTEDRPKRKYVRKKGIEMPPASASGSHDRPLEVPSSCTPNGLDKPLEVSNSCTPIGPDKSIEVPSLCTQNGANGFNNSIEIPNPGTSGARKPVRRCLNFDEEELTHNGYNNNTASQPNLTAVPVPPHSTGTTINVSSVPVLNSTVRAKGFSLDLNRSTNQLQEEFDRTFPPVSSTQNISTNQNGLSTGLNRVHNGSDINFSGYPYPPTPNVRAVQQQPNNHINNNNNNNSLLPCERNLIPNSLLALAMKNEQLIKETLGKSGGVNNLISTSGIKRNHNTLLQCNNNSSRAIDTQKKMRVGNGNNTLYQNGIVRPNSASISLHNVGPTSGVFSLADAQRIMELRKKQNFQAQQMLNGTLNNVSTTTTAPTTTSRCQVATPDRPEYWFMRSEPGPVEPVPVVHNINSSITSQSVVNSIQTYSEKTTTVNQNSDRKPEMKRRGRPKRDKQVLLLDPISTPPIKEKQPKPRGRKPTLNSIAMSASSLEYTIDSIIQKMRVLDINRISETVPVPVRGQQCYAMVPYNGGTGTMVPYNGEILKKKRKSRARVDLDPVTNQVWKLLMGHEMSEGSEPLDQNKEKVLEEERGVFKGRIDSFIARMHLVQGDRRFSPWKGSVVDSVVGVFLTQNVSDHLSSSAFMGLVSKYPPQNRPVNPQPVRENSLSIRSFIDIRNFHQKEIIIEDFTDLTSLITSEEKDENNSSQGSNNNNKKSAESSPDSGPGLVINSVEDQSSVVSSQNSVVSSQNSPANHNGSGWFSEMDPFTAPHTSYTQLLQFAELNRVDLFPDLNKVNNAMGTSCSYSNNSQFYSQNGNDYSAFHSGIINNASIGCSHPHNGNNCSNSVMPGMINGNNTGISEVPHNLNPEMRISIPRSSIANQTSARPITPMIKITQSTQNNQNAPNLQNPLNQNDYSNNSKTASETVHNDFSKTALETVHDALNNSSKTASEIAQASKAASEAVHNALNTTNNNKNSSNAASETVQNSEAASENVQNAFNSNNKNFSKAASETMQNLRVASETVQKTMDGTVISEGVSSNNNVTNNNNNNNKTPKKAKGKKNFDWDSLRRGVCPGGVKKERNYKAMDSLDYEALRRASVRELSDAIRERGMNNMLAERIKDFLDRLVRDHGSIDLEWLRDVDPDKAKDYLLSVRGLGLKSVECVRLLTLHHLAFPVDTNVGRICVRLGWVPLQPLPESLQLHLLEMYPILENIQKYLWPRLCKLDQRTLYELHYQMITFGKVFCTKSKPNCNACPMRAECKHFASAFASARLALPGPEEKGLVASSSSSSANPNPSSSAKNWRPPFHPSLHAPPPQISFPSSSSTNRAPPFHPLSQSIPSLPPLNLPSPNQNRITNEPIIEEPASPEPEPDKEKAIEDAFLEEDPDEIPTIKLDFEEFTQNLKSYIKKNNLEIEEADMSKALVAISPEKASLPTPKLKNISRLRTEHQVYELPDNHALLAGYEQREPDDPCPYLLSIWTPGETAVSTDPPKSLCISQDVDELCDKEACRRCVGIKEARRQIVRGTVLIPCRTAMRGSFPLNGTYFQVNELFADHESSRQPVECPRGWIWNLPRRTVYFGTSIPTIFKGLSTEEIQHCFWRGFVCVRGFDRATRAPRPLYARLHFPASKLNKNGRKAAKDED